MSMSGHLHRSVSALWPLNRLFALVEVRSMLLGFVVILALLVLAYFTNPNESSFRAFLTEQSFRQHLSRIDDAADDIDGLRSYNSDSALTTASRKPAGVATKQKRNPFLSPTSYASSPSLHFSGRAAVSLRTPKHVFRSFGILSIAAIVPSTSRKDRRSSSGGESGRACDGLDSPNGTASASTVETWFIGAFGMWWLAAHYDGLWHEAGRLAKDEDGSLCGLLDIKSLDHHHDHNYVKHPHNVPNGHHQQHYRTAPKLRNRSRERLVNGHAHGQGHRSTSINYGHIGHRSSSPPPLPKSASLPLHTKRPPSSASANDLHHNNNHRLHNGIGFDISHSCGHGLQQPPIHSQHSHAHSHSSRSTTTPAIGEDEVTHNQSDFSHSNSGLTSQIVTSTDPSQSLSTVFNNSPKIAELLCQLEASRVSLADIHSQLSDAQTAAAASHASHSEELEAQRARKRSDDAARTDLKARTRTLEEEKRTAESTRRNAEKRLKAARSARDGVLSRSQRLRKEVEGMSRQMEVCGQEIVRSGVETGALVEELTADLEKRRKEVKEADEEVAGLGATVRQMEERLEEEKKRLKLAEEDKERKAKERERIDREEAERREKEAEEMGFSQATATNSPAWQHSSFSDIMATNAVEGANVQVPETKGPSLPQEHVSPAPGFIPRRLSGASNPGFVRSPPETRPTLTLSPSGPTARSKGYSIFDEDIASLQKSQLSTSTQHGSIGFPFNKGSSNNDGFSPFIELEGFPAIANPAGLGGVISPISSSLIPSSLIQTLGIGPGVELDDAQILSGSTDGDLVNVTPNATSTPIEPIEVSRSFQSDSDMILERDWQNMQRARAGNVAPVSLMAINGNGAERSSPGSLSPVSPGANATGHFPFETRVQAAAAQQQQQRVSGYDEFGMLRRTGMGPQQRSAMTMPTRTVGAQDFYVSHALEGPTPTPTVSADLPTATTKDNVNRWTFGFGGREKKRLNPDAKEFSLSKETERILLSKNGSNTALTATTTAPAPVPTQSVPSFDMIKSAFTTPPLTHSQATALSSSTPSAKSTPSVSPFVNSWFGPSRAFAPLPEEREKLKRALGGSNNTSLDQLAQLSSLNDVGSLPASPKPAPGFVNHAHGHGHSQVHSNSLNSVGSSLWSSEGLPLKSKLTFSPFADDDEPSPSSSSSSQQKFGSAPLRTSPDSILGARASEEDGKNNGSRLKFVERSMTN